MPIFRDLLDGAVLQMVIHGDIRSARSGRSLTGMTCENIGQISEETRLIEGYYSKDSLPFFFGYPAPITSGNGSPTEEGPH